MASWQHSGFSVTMGNLDKESLRVRPASLSKMRADYENQSIHPRPKRNLQIHKTPRIPRMESSATDHR